MAIYLKIFSLARTTYHIIISYFTYISCVFSKRKVQQWISPSKSTHNSKSISNAYQQLWNFFQWSLCVGHVRVFPNNAVSHGVVSSSSFSPNLLVVSLVDHWTQFVHPSQSLCLFFYLNTFLIYFNKVYD